MAHVSAQHFSHVIWTTPSAMPCMSNCMSKSCAYFDSIYESFIDIQGFGVVVINDLSLINRYL